MSSQVISEPPVETKPGVTPRRATETNLRRTVLLAVIYAFSACQAATFLALGYENPDLWWHLATGEWIAKHHSFPWTDPFSAYGMGKPWLAYSWLFEVPLHWFYRWNGLMGTSVYVMLIAAAIGLALYRMARTRMGGFAAPIALTALGIVLMTRLYWVRPWLFSILFFTVELDILFAELVDAPTDRPSRRTWILPVLFAIWANIHIQFIYGLAVLFLAVLTQDLELVRRTKGLRFAIKQNPRRYRLWWVTGISLIATLANPYSWHLVGVILYYSRERVPMKGISEMLAPDFRTPIDYLFVLTILSAVFILGRVRLRSSMFLGTLLVSATMVSLRSGRDEWFAMVIAFAIIAAGSGKVWTTPTRVSLPVAHRIAAAVLALILIFNWTQRRNLTNARMAEDVAKVFPVKAADFVQQHGIQGPLYNNFEWGGYLMWRLPYLPVSIDGRTIVHGDVRLERSFDTWNGVSGWRSDPELGSANLVIGPVDKPLMSDLTDDSRFQLVYEDKTARVFVKRRN